LNKKTNVFVQSTLLLLLWI